MFGAASMQKVDSASGLPPNLTKSFDHGLLTVAVISVDQKINNTDLKVDNLLRDSLMISQIVNQGLSSEFIYCFLLFFRSNQGIEFGTRRKISILPMRKKGTSEVPRRTGDEDVVGHDTSVDLIWAS
ncbi:hypothetical protein PENFLA_c015G03712 [Penicillium flavigenum]|uniref:Uncharacterized protein n=1 Tax=Penicillium flavigenum TaxID=254877 RepID=A0A1V6T4K2_9EURO|nr:hypothetical protein PENFLA_c015G03712 [Penicillium flavigenum]